MIGEARLRRRPQHRSLLSQQRRHVSVCDAAEQRAMLASTAQADEKVRPPACSRTEKEWTMIFKIMAFVAAAIPIFLFVRSIVFRRPTRLNEGFKEFKKQSDVAVSIFLFLIGCVVIFAIGKLVWAWF
jgi:heme/copper-type cytochrome/quinol oxidase subunit 2